MLDLKDFQKQCRDMARAQWPTEDDAGKAAAMVWSIYDHCELALGHWQKEQLCPPLACGPGCATCCALNVAVLLPEAISISHYLREQYTDPLRDELERKLTALCRSVRWLDEEERLFVRRSCAFLDDKGCCAIWARRPLMCRAITSTDAAACREALIAPVFGEERPVVMNLVQRKIFEAAFAGLGEALCDFGCDARSFKLACAVPGFLREPQRVARFFRGDFFSW